MFPRRPMYSSSSDSYKALFLRFSMIAEYPHYKKFGSSGVIYLMMVFQVRERLRVALERNTSLEEEISSIKDEVSR